MKRKIFNILIACAAMLFAFGFSACDESSGGEITDNPPESQHEHVMKHVEYKEPECTVAGNIEYWKCGECGEMFSDPNGKISVTDTVLPAVGHKVDAEWEKDDYRHWHNRICGHDGAEDLEAHNFDGGIITETATCMTEGIVRYTCNTCGFYKDENIGYGEEHMLDTDWSFDDNEHWHETICGHAEAIERAPHNFDGGAYDPKKGETVFTCRECEFKRTEITETPCDHTFDTSRWETDGSSHWHPATCGHYEQRGDEAPCDIQSRVLRDGTCIARGEIEYACSVCDNRWTSETDFGDHDWDEGEIVRKGNCWIEGEILYTCELCSGTKYEYTGLGDHDYSEDASYDATYHWYRAECGHDVDPYGKAEHDWHNGSCSDCEAGLYYSLNDDGNSYTLCGVGCADLKSVIVAQSFTVPTEYKGKPVTKISQYALSNYSHIKTVIVPEGITEIGDNAFENCTSLNSLELPASLVKWGAEFGGSNSVLNGCDNLKRLIIKSDKIDCAYRRLDYLEVPIGSLSKVLCNAKEIKLTGSDGVIPDKRFKNVDILTEITLPDGVTRIGDEAFYGCTGLSGIIIPDGVTQLGRAAFCGCTGLSEIVLPSGITEIPESFAWSSGLERVTIKDGVRSIGERAFADCAINSLDLPSTVTEIGDSAFADCKITDLVLSEGVIGLGTGAFRNNPIEHVKLPMSLETIYPSNSPSSVGGTFENCPIERAEASAEWALFLPVSSLKALDIYGGTRIEVPQSYINKPKLLTSLKIASTVKSIADGGAFSGCTALTAIDGGSELIEFGSSAFFGCTSLEFTPDPATEIIGEFAFSELPIVSVEFTALKSLGDGAFSHCSLLERVSLYGSFSAVPDRAFYYCVKLNSVDLCNTVKSIGSQAFYMADIASITLPEALTEFGNGAFENCKKLEAVDIPLGVKHIAYSTFAHCYALARVGLHDGILTIGDMSFMGCRFTEISLPSGLESIGSEAFGGCRLTEISLPSTLKTIGESAFTHANITSVVIPSSVVFMGKHAFSICERLTTVTIQDGASGFQDKVFYGCNIKYATVPAEAASHLEQTRLLSVTVTSGDVLPENAFKDCATLTDVTLADSIKTIGKYAFLDCTALKNITLYAHTFGLGAFAMTVTTDYGSQYYATIPVEKVFFGGTLSEWINARFIERESEFNSIEGCNPIGQANGLLMIDGEALTELTVPQDITNISSSPFSGYKALTCVKIHDGVTEIGKSAFYGCHIISAYLPVRYVNVIPKENLIDLYLTHGTALDDDTLKDCANLRHVSLAESFESISRNAFDGCPDLVFSYLENSHIFSLGNRGIVDDDKANDYLFVIKAENTSVVNCLVDPHTIAIADGAFDGCTEIYSIRYENDGFAPPMGSAEIVAPRPVVLPETVRNIGDNDFEDCMWLNFFQLNSSRYTSYDGVLYKDNEIAVVPMMIGELETKLVDSGSVNHDHITRIYEFCTEIKAEQFANRPQLKKVKIGERVKEIGARVFYNCPNLTSINFGNNDRGWKLLTESGGIGESLSDIGVTVEVLLKSEDFYGMRRSEFI